MSTKKTPLGPTCNYCGEEIDPDDRTKFGLHLECFSKRNGTKTQAATSKASRMRLFVLERTEDVSGTSGTGIVAEGVVFSNGHVAYSWISPLATITTCQSVDVLEKLHGHEGRTHVRYL